MAQAVALNQEMRVSILSLKPKLESTRLSLDGIRIYSPSNDYYQLLVTPCSKVIKDKTINFKRKVLRILWAILTKVGLQAHLITILERICLGSGFFTLTNFMEHFDCVCVVSEASMVRSLVSYLKYPKKIQWIPTDYSVWRKQTYWTREVSKNDLSIYINYTSIVCLSDGLADKFVEVLPRLKNKVTSIPNFIDYKTILSKSIEQSKITVQSNCINFVTVARMEEEKQIDKLLDIADSLKNAGKHFHWYMVGGGSNLGSLQKKCKELRLDQFVTFTGAMGNPYSLMSKCDVFVLLSNYEGTPVTIDEAKVLGLYIVVNNVGGVSDQVTLRFGDVIVGENIVEKMTEVLKGICDGQNIDVKALSDVECETYNCKVYQKLLKLFNSEG